MAAVRSGVAPSNVRGMMLWAAATCWTASSSCRTVLAEFVAGLLANLTVIWSVQVGGMVPFSWAMAFSASFFLSNRTKPTPFDSPGTVLYNVIPVGANGLITAGR